MFHLVFFGTCALKRKHCIWSPLYICNLLPQLSKPRNSESGVIRQVVSKLQHGSNYQTYNYNVQCTHIHLKTRNSNARKLWNKHDKTVRALSVISRCVNELKLRQKHLQQHSLFSIKYFDWEQILQAAL